MESKKIIISVVVVIAIVLLVNNFNNLTGAQVREAVREVEETISYGGVSEEIALGSFFVERLENRNDGLITNEGLTVETSLTAQEDDYQTDVVFGVAKDSIRYYANNLPDGTLEGKSFNFLGNDIMVKDVGRQGDLMLVEVNYNGEDVLIKDGEAFIGEDKDEPNWVWDLSGLNTDRPAVAIENDFVVNDDSDKYSTKVGECIYLPNNYAKICLDSLNVGYDEYDTYTIEYEDGADLSDANGGTSEKTIYIHTSKFDSILLLEKFLTNSVWITGDGRFYYKDIKTNKVKYLKTISLSEDIGRIKGGLDLFITKQSNEIGVDIHAKIGETINTFFEVKDGEIESLGGTNNYAEATELTWMILGSMESPLNIGTKDEDHRTGYGIIIENPAKNGAGDEVKLRIPPRQVKARVNMGFFNGVSPVPESKLIRCVIDSDCFLNSGDTALVDGIEVKLMRVGSGGSIVVDVYGVQQTIRGTETEIVNGVEITNKETYYVSNNQAASIATIIIAKPKMEEVTHESVLKVLERCELEGLEKGGVCSDYTIREKAVALNTYVVIFYHFPDDRKDVFVATWLDSDRKVDEKEIYDFLDEIGGGAELDGYEILCKVCYLDYSIWRAMKSVVKPKSFFN